MLIYILLAIFVAIIGILYYKKKKAAKLKFQKKEMLSKKLMKLGLFMSGTGIVYNMYIDGICSGRKLDECTNDDLCIIEEPGTPEQACSESIKFKRGAPKLQDKIILLGLPIGATGGILYTYNKLFNKCKYLDESECKKNNLCYLKNVDNKIICAQKNSSK